MKEKHSVLHDLIFQSVHTDVDIKSITSLIKQHNTCIDWKEMYLLAYSHRVNSLENFINRCLHHHVFDTKLVVNVVHHMKLQIYAVEIVLPYHILIIAQKSSNEKSPSNQYFLGDKVEFLQKSPFPSDFKVGPLMDEET